MSRSRLALLLGLLAAGLHGIAAFASHGVGYVVVSRRSRTEVALLRLVPGPDGIAYEEVDRLALPATFPLPDGGTWTPCEDPGDLPQVEGMVVDPGRRLLFAGQEDVGIWRVKVTPHGFGHRPPMLQEKVREFGVPATYDAATEECVAGADPGFGGDQIGADVEGLTIGFGVLLASSQGDDTFAVFGDRGLGAYRGSFHIGDGPQIDSVQESDGAMLVEDALGPDFPGGLLVTQDGDEQPGEEGREASNFKLTRPGDVLGPLL